VRLAIIESPLSGDVPRNVRYARACMRDALMHGDAPFASHLLYAQEGVLDDLDQHERRLGIEAGFAWGRAAEVTLVYTDLGISAGMKLGIRDAEIAKRPIEYRRLGGEWSERGAA